MGATSTQPSKPISLALKGSRLFRLGRLLPGQPYRYQATAWMDPSPQRIILKARQIGISTAIMAEALDGAFTQPDSLALFVSRNERAATHILSYAYQMLRRLELQDQLVKSNETEMSLTNGSRLISLPASKDTGRGYPANHVYLDEHAHQMWAEDIFGAIAPTIARGGYITVVSTPVGRRNLFYRIWAGLEGAGWSRHIIPWRSCPVYDEAWYERERPKYITQQWAQEFDCDFVESGLTRFRPVDI